ncbi:TetR/AcrR family transcriptional regulator [Actinocatenispora rupis]|uniref:TetR family transcriptional regulator n=1 Tax=Actinocatenispora rupis TaxID=519421 RepID=A0A8J3J8M4_9ACTN|nr:TetR/AcrR family transcriptional regulator [Actinocatenispora rupis]GID13952.1 TetR family transcriptional regulator [Actinocatenispora rupis]
MSRGNNKGNKEALLAAAKTCLLEKGFDRTSVRDIATTAGVSTAAIGYHYGSREKLMFQALFAVLDEWGEKSGRALVPADEPGADPVARYVRRWDEQIAQALEHPDMFLASLELFMQARRQPDLLPQLADGMRQGRSGTAATMLSIPEDEVSDEAARTLGMVQMALLSGVVVQALADPEHAPTGAEVLAGIRALAGLGT